LLIREASREHHFGEVDGHFVLRSRWRVHRVMGRLPQANALLLAYTDAEAGARGCLLAIRGEEPAWYGNPGGDCDTADENENYLTRYLEKADACTR
jgi:hypothetical protein